MRFRSISLSLGLVSLAVGPTVASAQDGPQRFYGVTTIGEKGITRTVSEIMRNPNWVNPLKFANIIIKSTEQEVDRTELPQNPEALQGSSWPPYPTGKNPEAGNTGKDHGRPYSPQTIGVQWTGSQAGNLVPPDSFGAVGPTQILVTSNSQVKVYNKSGTLGSLNTTLDSFFASVGGNTSDPRATYDRISQRWFVICINVNSPNKFYIAVSSGPTITNTASFTFYSITSPSSFADYPSLGVDAKGVYIGDNTFNTSLTSYLGTHLQVIKKSSILSGGPIVSTRFTTSTATGTGLFSPRGVDNDDPASTDGYVIGVDNASFSKLCMVKVFNADTNSPTISANMTLAVPTTVNPASVPALGTTGSLDALDDRVYHAQMHLNRKTGKRTIYMAHNIRVDGNGIGSSGGNRNGCRWYEVDPTGASMVLVQAGTAYDPAASSPLYYWMDSCAQSGQGHMALGHNAANSATRVQVRAAGRLAGDPLGTTQSSTLAFQSTVGYNLQGGGVQRWGDYCTVNVDPEDDQTMWTIQEFAAASNAWGCRVVQLLAPPPSAVNSVSPNVLNQGQTTNVTINGTAAAGSEYYDTDASYTKRLQVAVSGTGVTVNSVSFSHANPQQIVVNVSVAGNATAGARDVTITNPDGQSTTASGALTINAGSTTETLAPVNGAVNIGQSNSGGFGDTAVVDNVNWRVCKFVVTSATSPIVRVRFDYTTTKTAPTAIDWDVTAKMVHSGTFKVQ
ncbi:MAG: hypothetical protein JST30_06210, partial [Armatimonadetes bacterium]|nr:hypothetical protein [Armatimonadota bacterium]